MRAYLLQFVRFFGLISVVSAGAFCSSLISSLLSPGDESATHSLLFFGYKASIVPYTHMGLLVGCGQVVVLLLFGCALGLLAARFSKGLVDAPSKKTLAMSFVLGAVIGLLFFPSAGSSTSSMGDPFS